MLPPANSGPDMGAWFAPLFSAILILIFIPIAILQWLAGLFITLTGLSFLYVKLIERQLIVERADQAPRTFRLAETPIRIRISNPLPVPLPYILISDESGGMTSLDPMVAVLSLEAGETGYLEYRVKSERRGRFVLGPGAVVFSDPLGLFRRQIPVSAPTELLVLPRVYPLGIPITRGLPIGAIQTANRLYEDPGRYRSMRDYVPGDDPRRIHWKASARTGSLQVMEYASTLSAPAVVVLNIHADAYTHGRKFQHFERCIEAAASLCSFYDSLDQEVALVINSSDPLLISRGKNQVPVMLEALAALEAPREDAADITAVMGSFRYSMADRITLVSPAIPMEQYEYIAASLPVSSEFEFWLLQDRQRRDGHVQHGMKPSLNRHRIVSLEEYGEDLLAR
jgi:uncharacterized protein (DUF58 family)